MHSLDARNGIQWVHLVFGAMATAGNEKLEIRERDTMKHRKRPASDLRPRRTIRGAPTKVVGVNARRAWLRVKRRARQRARSGGIQRDFPRMQGRRRYTIGVVKFSCPPTSSFMHRVFSSSVLGLLACGSMAFSCLGQTAQKNATADASASAERGIELAAKGQCQEALPILKRTTGRLTDKELKYRAGMATARCAMSLEQAETAVQALFLLKREFPHDPEVLFITTHYFSELATRASQELATSAPGAYQTHELEAEAMESQGKWDEAAAEYTSILGQSPNLPGIHYRLGRVYLSKPESAENTESAEKELAEELKIDPSNAAAEFTLGEIARRAGQWEKAIPHFSNAARIDAGFAEAFLALGMSLNAAQRFADAVAPLEKYVNMLPGDPAGHYQLAIAYDRTGHKENANRELQLQRATAAKTPAATNPPAPH
jgi:tetratricopeptide (TPR) repeat protein